MLRHYFYWQFVLAPLWLLELFWHLELVVVRYFSVPTMLRTLFSPWKLDTITYRGRSLTAVLQAFALNQISRLIGLIVRSTMLLTWLAFELIFVPAAVIFLLIFIAWPGAVLVLFIYGLALLIL